MALRTTNIKNVKLKIIKIMTGCQYIFTPITVKTFDWARLHKTFDWAACGLQVGHRWYIVKYIREIS